MGKCMPANAQLPMMSEVVAKGNVLNKLVHFLDYE